jgi:hypothetical protein
VQVKQHLDGRLEICYQGKSLVTFEPSGEQPVRVNKFSPAPGQVAPQKQAENKTVKKPTERKPHKPAADHPWRKPLFAKTKATDE